MSDERGPVGADDKIRTYRWFFSISLLQVLAFFIVPAFLFPLRYLFHIEIIASLTVGLVIAFFFLLVSICGLFLDRIRRRLYAVMIILVGLWFAWAIISWSYIEHMTYMLQ